jgi:hypothetical protein
VQGQLRKEYVAVEVETECKHCQQRLHITIDSKMRTSVGEAGAKPLVFTPEVDWDNFSERTIIDSY